MDGLQWKILIEVDDDWGYPHFRKPPYLVGEFNHLEKYEFVSWDYYSQYIMEK